MLGSATSNPDEGASVTNPDNPPDEPHHVPLPQTSAVAQIPSPSVSTPQVSAAQASLPQVSAAQALMPEVSVLNFLTSEAAKHARAAVCSLLGLKGPMETVQACSSTPMSGDKSIAKAVAHIQPASAPVSCPSLGPSSHGDEQSSFDFLHSLTSSRGKSIVCSWPSVGEPMNSHHEPKRIRLEHQSGNSPPTAAAAGSSGAPIQVEEADEDDIMEINNDDNDDDDMAAAVPTSGVTMPFPPVPIPPIGDPSEELMKNQVAELNLQRVWYYHRDHTWMISSQAPFRCLPRQVYRGVASHAVKGEVPFGKRLVGKGIPFPVSFPLFL